MIRLLLVIPFLVAPFLGQGQMQADQSLGNNQFEPVYQDHVQSTHKSAFPKQKKKKKRSRIRRGVAILLAILLGPFGVHRLYLGTSEMVPIFYALTLGGLLILPIVDIFCILFTKDLDTYLNNEKVVMW